MKAPHIDPEFHALIPPPPPAEREALEAAIVRDGCRDPLVTWRGLLLDGHTRFEICTRLGLRYTTTEVDLPSREAARAWILSNQCARRNLSEFQRAVMYARAGAERPATVATHNWARVLRAIDKGWADDILAGSRNAPHSFNSLRLRLDPPAPRPPRGPAERPHYIPEGHELSGVSTLTDANGDASGQWSKTRVAGADPSPLPETLGPEPTRVSRMTRADGTVVVEWQSFDKREAERDAAIKAAVASHVANYVRPAAPVDAPARTDADLLTVYPLGDPHVGMLAWANEVGEHFDLRIGERELCECMRQLVARSPASAECIVVNLGDFWHAQDDQQRTPKSGNKLDVDGRAGKVGQIGLNVLQTVIDTALTKHARVKFRSLPGNHDPHSSFWLPEIMRRTYRDDPRVTVEEGFNPYQFDVFGACLLGWAHGDGAKLEALGEIMATDAPDLWGRTAFRYWNTGHVHHWAEKELRGCVVSTHRTLAGRDAWHHHSGYRSGRALKAVTYHRTWGLDGTAVVGVERVRAALLAGRKGV